MSKIKLKIIGILKAITAVVLSVALVMGAIPGAGFVETAHAAGTGKKLQLGADVLNTNVNTASAPTVYYDNQSDVWRVIGYGGNGVASASGTMTLLANGFLGCSVYDDNSNEYSGSTLRSNIGTIEGRLSTAEASAVAKRTLEGGSANQGEDGYDSNKIRGVAVSDAIM
ncbi:MAG: hypothetical protein K6G42_07725, partial [Lachnospiraceae bacterium]|nr:hypothetical protein [Lachnospiraceae bacterium]